MKKSILLSAALILYATVWAQVPQGITHQAVIRDTGNELVTNQEVGIRVSILQGAPDGTEVYSEIHTPTSNANGLITFIIGQAEEKTGSFDDIDWSDGPYYLKTEADPAGGTDYSITGVTQFLSVPYALHAGSSGDNPWLQSGQDIYYDEGRVGIGLDDPMHKLQVAGNALFSPDIGIGHGFIDDEIGLTDLLVDRLIAGRPDAENVNLYQYGGTPGTAEGLIINTNKVGIGTESPSEGFHLEDANLLTKGTFGSSPELVVSGAGSKMFFYPRKSAFRAGYVNLNQWNDEKIGDYSVAMGIGTIASGNRSTALGSATTASGDHSTAFGRNTIAGGEHSTAMGANTRAIGNYAFAIHLSPGEGPEVPANTFQISGAANTIISEGNVGIGTDSPTEKLDINGQMRMREGAADGRVLVSAADGTASWADPAAETDPTWSGPANTTDAIGRTGNVGVGTTTPQEKLHVNDGIFLASGTFGTGTSLTVEGIGTRMFFYPRKAAFRAGYTEGEEWNNASIGDYSAAFGHSTAASGSFSFAAGNGAAVSGNYSVAMGTMTQASGAGSVAMGSLSVASGNYSVAMGEETTASSAHSVALGFSTEANGLRSVAIGDRTIANGTIAFAAGRETLANGQYSTAMGTKARANGDYSFAINLDDNDGPLVPENTFQISGATNTIISEGNVGIGTDSPTEKLDINGQMRMREGAAAGRVLVSAADGTASWADHATETDPTWSGPANTTDAIGRTGNIGVGTTTPQEKLHVNDGIFLASGTFGTGTSLTVEGIGTRMFFYPRKAAFRAGRLQNEGELWNEGNIGLYSTAFGYENKASGNFSTAFGRSARAEGAHSFAIHLDDTTAPVVPDNTFQISGATKTIVSEGNVGIGTADPVERFHLNNGNLLAGGSHAGPHPPLTVEGSGVRMFFYTAKGAFRAGGLLGQADLWDDDNIGGYSTAFGYETKASGTFSTAFGRNARAEGHYSFAVHLDENAAPVVPDHTFQISGATNTIISEGNVGIGTDSPNAKLHVDGGDAMINGHTVGRGAGSIETNIAVGHQSLSSNTTGHSNTVVGYEALKANTTGWGNVALGNQTLLINETGNHNIAVGNSALYHNSDGNMNIAIGYDALRLNESGNDNISIGPNSLLFNESGNGNIAIGNWALYSNTTGSDNLAIGYRALSSNSSGVRNTATGYEALRSNTGGSDNTAYGYEALRNNSSGYGNTALGREALRHNTTGLYNTAIGYYAGTARTNIIGGTFIGYDTRATVNDLVNVTAIGRGAEVNASNQVRLGNPNVMSFYCSGAWLGTVGTNNRDLYVDDTGKIGYVSSSLRYKDDIRDMKSIEWLYQLRPVNFTNKQDESKTMQFGLIAEEVEKIAPQFVSHNDDGLPETVSYSALITPLLKAVQEQQNTIREQQQQIDALMQRVNMLENRRDF